VRDVILINHILDKRLRQAMHVHLTLLRDRVMRTLP